MMALNVFEHGVIYVAAGAFAGLMAGILGIGGGMIVVPALLFIFHQTQIMPGELAMHAAAGTSLAVMIFTTQASVRTHIREEKVLWPVFFNLWPMIIAGTISGAFLAHLLPGGRLSTLLGVVLLLIAIKLLLPIPDSKKTQLPARWVTHLFSVIVGMISGLLGIGGGALIIPYLTYWGIARRDTAVVASLCTLTVSIIGTLSFISLGWHTDGLPPYSSGYVYWPAVLWIAIPSMILAPVGARLTYVLPVQKLKYAFVLVLLIAAADLLLYR